MVAATQNHAVRLSEMFWVHFSGAERGCEDFVFAVFDVCGSVCVGENADLQFNWAKFVCLSAVQSDTFLVN
jgi:hypothetical protein